MTDFVFKEPFFGLMRNINAQKFIFDGTGHDDKDTITLVSNDVRRYKSGFVYLIGKNKFLNLKSSQILPITDKGPAGNAIAVKLNRNQFNGPIEWSKPFIGCEDMKETSFEELTDIASLQKWGFEWQLGHYRYPFMNIEFLKW